MTALKKVNMRNSLELIRKDAKDEHDIDHFVDILSKLDKKLYM